MSESWDFHEGDEIVPGLAAMRLLGGGSSYEAYLAFDDHMYSPVVAKVVRPHLTEDRQTIRGLTREVEVLKLLNHPVIVRGFHADMEGSRPLLVLENLDGPRLSSLIRRHGPLPMQQLMPLAVELCSAAHYMQRMDIVHLDIKPSNIIMGAPAKLIDLSVARSSHAAAALTDPIGTDAYMAPEQCLPAAGNSPTHATDIWGIGATLFHGAAGYRPFDKGTKDQDAPAQEQWPQLELAPPYELPRHVPDPVAKLIFACLNTDPTQRPSAIELAEMVSPVMEALPKPRLSGFRVTAI